LFIVFLSPVSSKKTLTGQGAPAKSDAQRAHLLLANPELGQTVLTFQLPGNFFCGFSVG
jgi:hypothetical protein